MIHTDRDLLELAPDARPPPADARVEAAIALVVQLDDLSRALVLLYLDGYPYEAIADIRPARPEGQQPITLTMAVQSARPSGQIERFM